MCRLREDDTLNPVRARSHHIGGTKRRFDGGREPAQDGSYYQKITRFSRLSF